MFADLPWLPPPPCNIRDLIRGLKQDLSKGLRSEFLWERVEALAAYRLDEIQLSQVARIVSDLPQNENLPREYKLGLIGDGTLSLLGSAITTSALRRGLRVNVLEGGYGSAVSDAISLDSPLRQAKPDAVLVASDRRGLGLDRSLVSSDLARQRVEVAVGMVRSICEGLREYVDGAILVQTLVPPIEPYFGSFDLQYQGSAAAQVNLFNIQLAELASKNGYVLIDVARIAGTIGLERWDDPQKWHAAKLPFAADMIPAYAEFVARTLGAVYGRSRKCLVIDLDNTIWGGVIGDDGLGGIVLGQGSAAGEAFIGIQRAVLELRNRGIIIAVCTKNDEENARLPFREHTEMVLKEEHIAVFQANWLDKAANLKVIAEALNIGLDALVFLDDNPAERAQVRAELPMVAVPELPSQPALYIRALTEAGYFEAIAFGDEDRKRADDYRGNFARASLQAKASDMDQYLRSLEMTCSINSFDAAGRARVAQLINKTNQFNLTTKRYTEFEVGRMESDPCKFTVQVRLSDRFSDNGMISVVIANITETEWTLDTWLMSCRVLGRRVEDAVLRHLVGAARRAGATRLIGKYVPSNKNQMVCEHYRKLGFHEIHSDGAGSTWSLDLDDYISPSLPMQIKEALLSPPEAVSANQ